MPLTDAQKRFFEAWGYLHLKQLLRDDIHWITDEFEAAFRDRGVAHDGTQRSCIVPFIDQRERLCTLLDHPKLIDVMAGLLGNDFNYLGGDGNFYTGDTAWHSDGFHSQGLFLKVALYLDPVDRNTGALRVIPGTHRTGDAAPWAARDAGRSQDLWGIPGSEVPAMSLDSMPGDVVAFNHNLMHSSWGGTCRRRMFTLNACRRCRTESEIDDLRSYINGHGRFWIDHLHSHVMRSTGPRSRQIHLQQVMDLEGDLAHHAERSRREMAEPSRG